MSDSVKPTTETQSPNLSTEHQNEGDARRPSDTLDKPNKPGAGFDEDGEDQSVKNQSIVTPDSYPDAKDSAPA